MEKKQHFGEGIQLPPTLPELSLLSEGRREEGVQGIPRLRVPRRLRGPRPGDIWKWLSRLSARSATAGQWVVARRPLPN